MNDRNIYGFTALAGLALRGNQMDIECADILLAAGADVNLAVGTMVILP